MNLVFHRKNNQLEHIVIKRNDKPTLKNYKKEIDMSKKATTRNSIKLGKNPVKLGKIRFSFHELGVSSQNQSMNEHFDRF